MKKIYNNRSTFFPTEHDTNFTIISNSLLEDDRLSLLDVGIMTYILKFVNFNYDGRKYIVHKGAIEKRSGFGYRIFTKSWNNLIKCGYINAFKVKSGWEYEIYEKPIKNTLNETGKHRQHLSQITLVKNTICQNDILERKKKEKGNTSIETLDSRPRDSRAPDFSRADTIVSAEAETSISVPAVPAVDYTPEETIEDIFQYDMTQDYDLELPQLDIELQEVDNDFDN